MSDNEVEVNPLNPPRRAYRVQYEDGGVVYIFSQHHEVLSAGAVAFYDRNETVNPPRTKFLRTIPFLRLHDFDQVEYVDVPKDAKTIGVRPYLGPPPRNARR